MCNIFLSILSLLDSLLVIIILFYYVINIDKIVPCNCTSPVAGCLPAQYRIGFNVVFFHIYQSQSMHNYTTKGMAFNLYSAIKERISEVCDAIQNDCYSNCTQAATVY